MKRDHSPLASKSVLELIGRLDPSGYPLTAPTLGIWRRRGHELVVVRVRLGDEEGSPVFVQSTEAARAAFLDYVASIVGEIVVADALLHDDPIGERALERRLPLWIVPFSVLESVRYVAGTRTRSPRRYATLLARLPHYVWLQSLLRRLPPRGHGAQLGLL